MRKTLVVISLVLSLLVIALVSGFTFMNNGHNVSVTNSKGLDDDGVFLITAADPRFSVTAAGMPDVNRQLILEAAGPFGVLVQNETTNDIVGCSLKWELMGADGKITILRQEYNHPGALVGMEPLDPNMVGRTAVINAKSTAFLSLDPHLKNSFDFPDLHAGATDKDRLSRINKSTNKQLRNVVAITISIDGVVFNNGEFLGTDTAQFYKRVQELVNAKRDVENFFNTKIRERRDSSEILRDLSSKVNNSPFALSNSGDPEYDRAYDGHFKRFVEELEGMRDVNDDEAILKYAKHGSDKIRELHKKK